MMNNRNSKFGIQPRSTGKEDVEATDTELRSVVYTIISFIAAFILLIGVTTSLLL